MQTSSFSKELLYWMTNNIAECVATILNAETTGHCSQYLAQERFHGNLKPDKFPFNLGAGLPSQSEFAHSTHLT
ncbi:hypothetical protein FRX31_002839 [Thalictrum thalictroides]|uniref:Uncharacterized protein n=1 Tax=Thalictrum thalictroides TaxID=46969 RepID=A0A7J6XDE5_THATH|nr:hypothetical protein FRX31_002839 [Thalictrum thalictroides]